MTVCGQSGEQPSQSTRKTMNVTEEKWSEQEACAVASLAWLNERSTVQSMTMTHWELAHSSDS